MINQLQVEQFAGQTGYDLIIFLAYYSHSKKNGASLLFTTMLSGFKIENMALLVQVYYTIVSRYLLLSW